MKRPGHVTVTTEVGFCSFCGRPRNLRNEEHQLGALVRTIVTCETCHRTLSSSIGAVVAEAAIPEAVAAEDEGAPEPVAAAPAPDAKPTKPAAKPAKPAARAAAKPATKSKPAAAAAKSTPSKTGAKKKAR